MKGSNRTKRPLAMAAVVIDAKLSIDHHSQVLKRLNKSEKCTQPIESMSLHALCF